MKYFYRLQLCIFQLQFLQWLPKYKGAVAGSVVAGFGLGAMVFNPIITIFINPDNKNATYAPYKSKPKEKLVLLLTFAG